MSKRIHIRDGWGSASLKFGLIYTEVLGWIDLGHAQGTDIRMLLNDIERGEASREPFYTVNYRQYMVDPNKIVKMGKYITWRIKRGRTQHERQSIALAMMMIVAGKFEKLQNSFPVNVLTDSGFSGEDLVSDLFGFYRVVSNQNHFHQIRPVSLEEALKRWDFYGPIGRYKNDKFIPLLFPDPEKSSTPVPYRGTLPSFMQTVRPYSDFQSGNVIVQCNDGSFMDNAKKDNLRW